MVISTLIAFTSFVSCSSLNKSNPHQPLVECPSGTKNIPLSQLNWGVEYSGYGSIEFSQKTNEIFMSPRAARGPQSTHASLIPSKFILNQDYDLFVEYKNNKPLRAESPNPWEVFWLFFQYQKSEGRSKLTNYLMAKPNGIEMGKAFDEDGQTFIKTVDHPKASFNQWHLLRIKKQKDEISVYFDQQKVFDWKAPEDSNDQTSLFTHQGQIGLYSEDASVVIRRVCVDQKSI